METLLQRFHFGAVIRLHFGTTMNNGSQHVGSKTGVKFNPLFETQTDAQQRPNIGLKWPNRGPT